MVDRIRELFEQSIETKRRSLVLADAIARSASLLADALRNGRKILVCGNGGSAADAQHFAAELVGRFEQERAGLPALALTTDSSFLTAWSNDYGFETVFARQVEALGVPGDVLVAISTSGNSRSILRAVEAAARAGIACLTLSGRGGGELARMAADCHLVVPSESTARIQEVHITIVHVWCRLIEEELAR
jgi:D-sedoheptulose 7-phosphate isomerase